MLYPAVHELTAYAGGGAPLPRAEAIARRQLTLPLFGHLSEEQQDLVVGALGEALAT